MSLGPWSPQALMAKADTACSSARALLALDDVDGAANRAYYAMFDAARAALLASGALADPLASRTHSGLISSFGLHLVKSGQVPPVLGKQLNRAHEVRLVADYNGHCVEAADARELVEQAEAFVAAMRTTFLPHATPPSA